MSTKSITKKLLIYLDPHPIRNIFTEFYNSEIRKLLPAIIRYMPEDYDVRIFSNNLTINEIAAAYPELCPALIRPFPLEDRKILSYFHQWDEKSISERSSLVLGLGEISEFYMGILERIHSDVFDFNCILIWSDNGAVKKFAKDNDIVLLCAESGPTEYYGGWEHSNMLPRATYKKHTRNYNMLVRAIRAQWTQMAVPSRL